MKNIYKNILKISSFCLLVVLSCETFELDLTEDPNFLIPSQADPDLLLNNIQEDLVRHLEGNSDFDPNEIWSSGGNTNGDGLSLFGMQLTRLMAMTSNQQYNNVYQGSDSDDEWSNLYSGILADIRALTPLAEEAGLNYHIGITQFIEAYVITAMVDFYGDIPYTEALQGVENLNPSVDSGASIYDAALALLNNALTNFNSDANADPAFDAFYGNDFDLWINATNTLRIKLLNQRRLVDPSAASSIMAIIASGDYIMDTADDFQYNWPATSASQPDNRHPRYGFNYQSAGANDYNSNWLMNQMSTTNDPRIRYYFYRQNDCTPGAPCDAEGNEETLQCSLQTAPTHYLDGGFTFCYLENGYWGRDHADDAGTPPDGFLRTTFGVYPAGGNFDDDRFEGVEAGGGGAGAGITPILTAAWIDFIQAELAMAGMDPTTAKTYMLSGMVKHINKVMSYGSLDPNADLSMAPSTTEVEDYITAIGDAFDAAATMEEKWDIFAEQFLIASYGNGVEAYNFYRRTGYPTTLQPSLDPSPGSFVRSMFYPTNAVNTNSNISQKADVSTPVFWDTNTSAPIAN